MSADSGPGRGGTALFVSPGRVPRSVAFAPAVRGYPGGIADMAADLDEYGAELSFGDDDPGVPAAAAEPAGTVAAELGDGGAGPGLAGTGSAAPGQQAPGQQVPDQPPAEQHLLGEPGQRASAQPASAVSVWQQSATAWHEAGIEWMRPATAGPRPAVPPAADDDPHTEPIPVLTADGSPRAARTGDTADRPSAGASLVGAGAATGGAAAAEANGVAAEANAATAEANGATAQANGATAEANGATTGANGAAVEADAPPAAKTAVPPTAAVATTPGVGMAPGQDARAAAHEDASTSAGVEEGAATGGADSGTVAGVIAGRTTQAKPGKKAGPGKREKASAGQGKPAGPEQGEKASPSQGKPIGPEQGEKTSPERNGQDEKAGPGRDKTARRRLGRRVTIVAVIALVLVAGTVAGIGIARSGGPAEPEFTVVTPYPPAVAADAELAGQTAGAASLLGSLTGIAAAAKTVVAIGAEPSQPAPVPLILFSADGGHTWAQAAVAGAGPGAGTGTSQGTGGPAGPGSATGPGPAGAGTTAGGPGTAPVLIAHGGGTWLALGQYAAWTSSDGRTWHQAPPLPPVAGDRVLGLAGTSTGFVAVGEHTGSHPRPVVWTSSAGRPWQRWTGPGRGLTARSGHVTALRWAAAKGGVVVAGGPITGAAGRGRRPDAGVWRSANGGRTWKPVTLASGHGATAGLAGLAASPAGFVAVRPGRAAGRQDAVAYQSAHGATWRYAGKLTPIRRTSLRVTMVSGSSHGFVVAAYVRGSEVAFFSARGRAWHRTAAGAGAGVAGLVAGPGGTVVAAGNSQAGTGAAGTRPHLILISPVRKQVGQASLAATATPDATVNGLAAGGRTLVAAGSADGSPALWLGSAGQWAPAGVLLPQAWRNGALVSVAYGDDGWLAVGRASAAPSAQAPVPAAPPASQPVILTSATGTSWAPAPGLGPLAAPGNSLVQAAAGPAGYVVVGSARTGGTRASAAAAGGAPAAWYSKTLGTWAHATLPVPSGYVPAGAPGSRVLAVTAGAPGFVAVGSAGNTPAAWTSPNGSAWHFTALPVPAGAVGAVLTQVTAAGTRVVAAGYDWRAGAPSVPFSAASSDGGRTWRDARLPAPAPTVVTALTTAGGGFVAVGHTGPPGRPVMLAWWSADGLTWQGRASAAGGPGGSFVTQINAVTAGRGTLTGAGFAAGTTAEHPVLWHARYR